LELLDQIPTEECEACVDDEPVNLIWVIVIWLLIVNSEKPRVKILFSVGNRPFLYIYLSLLIIRLCECNSLVGLVLSLESLIDLSELYNWLIVIEVVLVAPVAIIKRNIVEVKFLKLLLRSRLIELYNAFEALSVDKLDGFVVKPLEPMNDLSYVTLLGVHQPVRYPMLNLLRERVSNDELVSVSVSDRGIRVDIEVLHEIRCHVEGVLCLGHELRGDVGDALGQLPLALGGLIVAGGDAAVNVEAREGEALEHELSILAEVHVEVTPCLPVGVHEGGEDAHLVLINYLHEAELSELFLGARRERFLVLNARLDVVGIKEGLLVDLIRWQRLLTHEEHLGVPFAIEYNLLPLLIGKDLEVFEISVVLVILDFSLHSFTHLGTSHSTPGSDLAVLVEGDELVLDDPCYQVGVSLSHAHEEQGVPMEHGHHLDHVER
jgi:hypothetical protein